MSTSSLKCRQSMTDNGNSRMAIQNLQISSVVDIVDILSSFSSSSFMLFITVLLRLHIIARFIDHRVQWQMSQLVRTVSVTSDITSASFATKQLSILIQWHNMVTMQGTSARNTRLSSVPLLCISTDIICQTIVQHCRTSDLELTATCCVKTATLSLSLYFQIQT